MLTPVPNRDIVIMDNPDWYKANAMRRAIRAVSDQALRPTDILA
ncbi:hypothetical protein [Bradyrhizobium jicamae]|nr:hypothetical protein [Bradyrhizobium jicamae]